MATQTNSTFSCGRLPQKVREVLAVLIDLFREGVDPTKSFKQILANELIPLSLGLLPSIRFHQSSEPTKPGVNKSQRFVCFIWHVWQSGRVDLDWLRTDMAFLQHLLEMSPLLPLLRPIEESADLNLDPQRIGCNEASALQQRRSNAAPLRSRVEERDHRHKCCRGTNYPGAKSCDPICQVPSFKALQWDLAAKKSSRCNCDSKQKSEEEEKRNRLLAQAQLDPSVHSTPRGVLGSWSILT